MNDKYIIILEVSNTDKGNMPLDGYVATQVIATDRVTAISDAKRKIYNMYGGNNEIVAVFPLTADVS
ncbi:hypothetical protein GYA27_00955 [candidate division WWE3 bacterium]|uniref:Uncharacterized protein n=1 Tax=candidate division WWE3 bacterium TaxID=2053526 RepID=A0A7X9HHN9_UNCKA|nr:hypothetical protein [candidate division WWE3 bacterium]